MSQKIQKKSTAPGGLLNQLKAAKAATKAQNIEHSEQTDSNFIQGHTNPEDSKERPLERVFTHARTKAAGLLSPQNASDQNKMRVQKFLAYKGLCSRREGEQWILEGEIWVNGVPATLGQSIDPTVDTVKVKNQVFKPEPLVRTPIVLLMNKPRRVICSHSDPFHNETIFDLLPERYKEEKLFLAGRLDKDSEGLLILTNDGGFAQALTHPSFEVIKKYQVILNRDFDPAHIKLLLKGVEDEGEHLYAVKAIPSTYGGIKAARQLEVHLAQGRKREVRRLFEAIGYFVHRLKRTHIGPWSTKGIATGSVKALDAKEIATWMKRLTCPSGAIHKNPATLVKKAKRYIV
jgi:23S rRNA pseudouridine2605 synthase